MRNTRRSAWLAGAAAVAISMCITEQAAAADASSEGATISELIVTANKREEKIRDVAGSVSAYSGEPVAANAPERCVGKHARPRVATRREHDHPEHAEATE